MGEVVLYQYPGDAELPSISAPCCRVHLALQRLGVPFRVVNVESPHAARRVSRTGRLPAIEVDGVRLSDSVAVVDKAEELAGRPLGPGADDPVGGARDRVWEYLANDSLYWVLVYLRWGIRDHAERTMAALTESEPFYRRWGASLYVPWMMRRRLASHGIGARPSDEVERELSRLCGLFEEGLAGGPFLEGRQTPGRGDLALASSLVQFGWRGACPSGEARLRGRPTLIAHARAVFEACDEAPPSWLGGGAAAVGA